MVPVIGHIDLGYASSLMRALIFQTAPPSVSQDSTVSHNTLNYCVISVTHRLTEQTGLFESSINTLLMCETASQVQILLRLEA